MEADEDMFVVIVEDEENNSSEGDDPASSTQSTKQHLELKEETTKNSMPMPIEDLLETVEKHGKLIKLEPIKEEPEDYEYLDTESIEDEYLPDWNEGYSDDDYMEDMDSKHRYKMLKPSEQRSFVKELSKNYPELKEDKQLLVTALCNIMRTIKPPPPPQDYFIMNDVNFECTKCGAINESMPAASRHWQEKHGKRYLVCFACGVDFRSTTNLYKHEKRCNSPDSVIVLKARALLLGRKGRGRPFIPKPEDIERLKPEKEKRRFPCTYCPADFSSKVSLESHSRAHNGSRPFRCKECPAAYTSKSGLAKHMVKHTDIEFICDHCSRSFKTKTTLIAHLDTHKALRKFPCEICGRRFAQRSAMQLHVDRTHRALPPPCACQICPKRYPRMSLLKNHMLKAHGMNLITRKMFYKTLPFLSESQLQEAKVVLKSEVSKPNEKDYIFHTINEDEYASNMEVYNNENSVVVREMRIPTNSNEVQETIQEEADLSEEVMQYIRKLQQGQIDSNTRFVVIENGQITCVDESNYDMYKMHISEVEAAFENCDSFIGNTENGEQAVVYEGQGENEVQSNMVQCEGQTEQTESQSEILNEVQSEVQSGMQSEVISGMQIEVKTEIHSEDESEMQSEEQSEEQIVMQSEDEKQYVVLEAVQLEGGTVEVHIEPLHEQANKITVFESPSKVRESARIKTRKELKEIRNN